jgi:hypothetical protein
MQYDELAHHFGPRSPQALADLKRTDARIKELLRMVRVAAGRGYDVVILSDHGMTPALSYRVAFRESLGTTVASILAGDRPRPGRRSLRTVASFAEDSEYADVGAQVLDAAALVAPPNYGRVRKVLRRARDWVRRHYGLREIILPEKYRVDVPNAVVVTYSSCLAQLYFADDERPLTAADVTGDPRRAHLYRMLLGHLGIGLIATRIADAVHVESRRGRAIIRDGHVDVTAGTNPLVPYGEDERTARAVESLVRQPNGGDLVLFGAYDGDEIVSFDDQVGAHGCVGGDQTFPFLITPPQLDLTGADIEDARDIHRVIMARYAAPPRSETSPGTERGGEGASRDGAPRAGGASRGPASPRSTMARKSAPLSRSGSDHASPLAS